MNQHAALLEAIRQSPTDDVLRLVYADWLEEHGEDTLAGFVRLQCRLEPLRSVYHDEETDSLRARESKLIDKHQAAWLGQLAPVVDDRSLGMSVTFRRGLVEQVQLPTELFLAHAETLIDTFPALHELVLFDARDKVEQFADCSSLRQFRKVTFADWLTVNDLNALARSSHLTALECLELWLGDENDLDYGGPLGRLTTARNVRLVQLLGGYAIEEAPELEDVNNRANILAHRINLARGEAVATVVQPFARRFPLWRDFGYGMFAGRIDGRQALLDTTDEPTYHFFDEAGELTATEHRPIDIYELYQSASARRRFDDQELLAWLDERHGFTLDSIHVREFRAGALAVHLWPSYLRDILLTCEHQPADWTDRWEMCREIHDWLARENFVIDNYNDYWAGPDGEIHSS